MSFICPLQFTRPLKHPSIYALGSGVISALGGQEMTPEAKSLSTAVKGYAGPTAQLPYAGKTTIGVEGGNCPPSSDMRNSGREKPLPAKA